MANASTVQEDALGACTSLPTSVTTSRLRTSERASERAPAPPETSEEGRWKISLRKSATVQPAGCTGAAPSHHVPLMNSNKDTKPTGRKRSGRCRCSTFLPMLCVDAAGSEAASGEDADLNSRGRSGDYTSGPRRRVCRGSAGRQAGVVNSDRRETLHRGLRRHRERTTQIIATQNHSAGHVRRIKRERFVRGILAAQGISDASPHLLALFGKRRGRRFAPLCWAAFFSSSGPDTRRELSDIVPHPTRMTTWKHVGDGLTTQRRTPT